MEDDTITREASIRRSSFELKPPTPVLLVAHCPVASAVDRCAVADTLTVGRKAPSDLQLADGEMSSVHFRIESAKNRFSIRDLGSRNGTFVDGRPAIGAVLLGGQSVIRAGASVFVFSDDGGALLRQPSARSFGMAGRFFVQPLLDELDDAARSTRHLLLVGETGTGKELAARAFAAMIEPGDLPLAVYNSARYASREEITAALFGVRAKAFSGVEARPGLIEKLSGGVLFLDEVHNLPDAIQRALLRVLEDGCVTRVGDTTPFQVTTRFVLASNADGDSFGLVPDLLARLRAVALRPLSERRADVPSIFLALLRDALDRAGSAPEGGLDCIGGDHVETLCLADFTASNVRALVDLSDRIATRIASGDPAETAVAAVFVDRFGGGPVASRTILGAHTADRSRYEANRSLIVAAYRECGGNLSEVERRLKSRGFTCSRRWLSVFLDKWGTR